MARRTSKGLNIPNLEAFSGSRKTDKGPTLGNDALKAGKPAAKKERDLMARRDKDFNRRMKLKKKQDQFINGLL